VEANGIGKSMWATSIEPFVMSSFIPLQPGVGRSRTRTPFRSKMPRALASMSGAAQAIGMNGISTSSLSGNTKAIRSPCYGAYAPP
jgi:hypothetical protein